VTEKSDGAEYAAYGFSAKWKGLDTAGDDEKTRNPKAKNHETEDNCDLFYLCGLFISKEPHDLLEI
jgi:hypothetical protein